MGDDFACVYGIQNLITGRIYIGSTSNWYKRKSLHINTLKDNKHANIYLQRSWDKHGEKAFKFFIVERCSKDKETLCEREQFWFNHYKENGLVYNIRKIAESNLGIKFNEEHKEKMKKAQEWRIGIKRSEETKNKISETMRKKNDSVNNSALDSLTCPQ
jgi:group I intron endonuclease